MKSLNFAARSYIKALNSMKLKRLALIYYLQKMINFKVVKHKSYFKYFAKFFKISFKH